MAAPSEDVTGPSFWFSSTITRMCNKTLGLSSECMDTSRGFLLRLIERLIGVIVVLLFWPTMLMAYFLIRVTSNGPVVLTDEFPAGGGGMARSYRLRTTGRGSSAFLVIGRFLRKYAIDELPVFWSLARSDIGLRDVLNCFGHK